MKITFILPIADWGGGCRVVATYAHQLAQMGHDVVVVHRSPNFRSRLSLALSHFLSSSRWDRVHSHLDALNVPQIRLFNNRTVTDADIPDADVVIATAWTTASEVLALSPEKGAKAYFIQHYEEVFDDVPKKQVKETWTYPMRKIVVAPWLLEIAKTEFGDASAILVPNGVSTEFFTAPPRHKCAVPTAGFVFSHVGFKGSDIAIKAFEIVRKEIPNLRLVSFGNSWRRSLRNGLSLPKNTEYQVLPPQGNIRDLYAQCDVWVCASRSEGFGLPMLEAMSCRTPVVSTPTGIAPLLAEQGGLQIGVHDDPQGLARQIRHVLDLPAEDWLVLSQQAHATAQHYVQEEAALRFERALKIVASEKH
jgi:glycosyltransferase involved in cell wall biosynthesis